MHHRVAVKPHGVDSLTNGIFDPLQTGNPVDKILSDAGNPSPTLPQVVSEDRLKLAEKPDEIGDLQMATREPKVFHPMARRLGGCADCRPRVDGERQRIPCCLKLAANGGELPYSCIAHGRRSRAAASA